MRRQEAATGRAGSQNLSGPEGFCVSSRWGSEAGRGRGLWGRNPPNRASGAGASECARGTYTGGSGRSRHLAGAERPERVALRINSPLRLRRKGVGTYTGGSCRPGRKCLLATAVASAPIWRNQAGGPFPIPVLFLVCVEPRWRREGALGADSDRDGGGGAERRQLTLRRGGEVLR